MTLAKRARLMVVFAVVLLLPLLVEAGRGMAQEPTPTSTEAQPTPLPPPVVAFRDGEAVFDTLPAGPATVNVTSVFIAPRVALRTIVTNGPMLILVNSGTVTIDADAALVGEPPSGLSESLRPAATPLPAEAVSFAVPNGNQIILSAGARLQLRNATDEEVGLTIISIAPEGEEGFGPPAN